MGPTWVVGSIKEVEQRPDLCATPPKPLCVGDDSCAASLHSNNGVIDCYRYPVFVVRREDFYRHRHHRGRHWD